MPSYALPLSPNPDHESVDLTPESRLSVNCLDSQEPAKLKIPKTEQHPSSPKL